MASAHHAHISNKRPMGLCALLNNQLGHGPKFQKLWHSTLFLSQDVENEHIFALWAAVSEIMADLQNCHIWAWNLHAWLWPKFQKCNIYSLSPRGSKWSSFSLYGQRILRYWPNVKTVIFRHEFQKLHIYSFYHRGSKLSLFLLYGQRFPRYGTFF